MGMNSKNKFIYCFYLTIYVNLEKLQRYSVGFFYLKLMLFEHLVAKSFK